MTSTPFSRALLTSGLSQVHYHIFLIARRRVKDLVCYRIRDDKCPLGDWYRDLDPRSRARLDTVLALLIASKKWEPPYFRWLAGKRHRGVGEIYVKATLQYRLLCCAAETIPDRMVALLGCYHKDRVYTPASALDTAVGLRSSYLAGAGKTYAYAKIFTIDE